MPPRQAFIPQILREYRTPVLSSPPREKRMIATATAEIREPGTLRSALAAHWPEYLMEAACLGTFMLSACIFGVLLDHPASFLNQSVASPAARRALGGLAMGLTAIALILSPWGKRSGAHMNPAVTLTFLALGKVAWRDAVFYIAAQFGGGIAGVALADLLIGLPLRHSSVNYVVTVPGAGGTARAFLAELLISSLLMTAVLIFSNHRRITGYTPLVAGALVATYITVEAPISGMSMNPARTYGSAFSAHEYTGIWIYFIAPVAGMLAAGWFYRFARGARAVHCAKFHHNNNQRCIFRCEYHHL